MLNRKQGLPSNWFLLLVALVGGIVVFIPFAVDTSPWDAVRLKVPENQGNWWHVLVGAPFFLAFPTIWIRVLCIRSRDFSVSGGRVIWAAVGLSAIGTVLVEAPFLLHLAGTSEWQRFAVIALGLGIMAASAGFLFVRRRRIPPADACIAGLNAAWLSNASLCLVVYSSAVGPFGSRSGWFVTMAIVWPMAAELLWIFSRNGKVNESLRPVLEGRAGRYI